MLETLHIENYALIGQIEVDFVDGFIGDDFLENVCWCGPVQRFHDQKTTIEPGIEQVMEVGIDALELRGVAHGVQQVLAHLHQSPGAV